MAEDTTSKASGHMADVNPSTATDGPHGDPRPAAVTFATTEHFTLQGARAATIAESTGRASMFLMAVYGGLVALGLIATASRVGTAFYAFGLVLLPTLTWPQLPFRPQRTTARRRKYGRTVTAAPERRQARDSANPDHGRLS